MDSDILMRLTQSLGIGRAILAGSDDLVDANHSASRSLERLRLSPRALLRGQALETGATIVSQHNGWTTMRLDVEPGPVVVHHRVLDNGGRVLILLDPAELPETGVALLRAIFKLTPTEARVAQLVMAGATNASIAKLLGVGPGTARTHIKSLYLKTGTQRQSQLTAILWRMCFLPYSARRAKLPAQKATA